jgi:Protein of unknown function (DUF3105)
MDHRTLLAAGAAGMLALAPLAACGDGDTGTDAGAGGGETEVEVGEVATFDDLSQDHVRGDVDYPQAPPVGGEHWEVWQDCGVYDEPVLEETAVHSLEHGAVWITYRADLPADQVELAEAYGEQAYVLVSPWPEDGGRLPAPIVLSAWGAQLALESLPAPEADAFLDTYRSGPTTPEPGAPCTGGLALTADEAEARMGDGSG